MMTSEELVKINKDYFVKITTLGAKALIVSYAPFLAVPPLSMAVDKLLNMFFQALANGLELVAFYEYIDLRVTKQGRDYVAAKKKGFEIELTGTVEEKKIAEKNIKDTFGMFAKFTT